MEAGLGGTTCCGLAAQVVICRSAWLGRHQGCVAEEGLPGHRDLADSTYSLLRQPMHQLMDSVVRISRLPCHAVGHVWQCKVAQQRCSQGLPSHCCWALPSHWCGLTRLVVVGWWGQAL